jgi:hypothetical protein
MTMTKMKKEPAPIKFPPDKKLAKLFERVLKLASRFPGVEASRSYGTPAIKAKGKFLARLRTEAEGGLAVPCSFNERDLLLMAAPDVFYITDHYTNYPIVLINLEKVNWDALPQILENAWRMHATPKTIKEYESSLP